MILITNLNSWSEVEISAVKRLPDTEQGKAVASYIEAFNSGDDAMMDRFQQEHMASQVLQKRSKDQRMARYHEVRSQIGTIEFQKVLNTGNGNFSILARSGKGEWLQFNFEFEKDPPHGLLGISIDQATGLDEGPAESLPEAQLIPSIEKYLADRVAKDEFSGVVLLAKNGRPVFEKAYGMASKKYAIPNKVDTIFNIGSINKDFTAAAILLLSKAGKLSLDDTIDRYLPDFPKDKASKITIRQLLEHRSGLGDFFGAEYIAISKDKLVSNHDFIQLFISHPLEFEPGTNRRYSNAGYVMLGEIIEKLSGQDYYGYIREHIYQPAGMTHSGHYSVDEEVPNLATGYTHHYNGDQPDSPQFRNHLLLMPARGSAAGGGYSTAQDLLKFVLALKDGKFTLPFGNGNGDPSGQKELPGLGLAGGAPGLNAAIETFPRHDYILVVMSNYDPPSAETIASKLRGWIQNLQP